MAPFARLALKRPVLSRKGPGQLALNHRNHKRPKKGAVEGMTLHSLVPMTFALLVALSGYAQAETGDSPPPPDRNPVRVQGSEAD